MAQDFKKLKNSTDMETLHEYSAEAAQAVIDRNRAAGRIPYMICTDKRAVLFGYCEPEFKDPLTIYDMRNVLQWSGVVSGVFGLSDVGPIDYENDGSRVGARTQSAEIPGITARCPCSDRAEWVFNIAPPKARTK